MNKFLKYIIGSTVVVIILWGLTFLLYINPDNAWRGTFGDMFGAVNALFSGFAFAGLIITLIMQYEELSMQRKELEKTNTALELQKQELEQTNDELKGQRQEFEQQNSTLKIQRFENTLFNLLSQQQEIINNLHYRSKDGADLCQADGRATFDLFYNTKVVEFGNSSNFDNIRGIKELISKKDDIHAYQKAYDIQFFDHYFRHLYRIFKYIHDSKLIDVKDKYEYAAIVRAQLSEYELLMLFYNALNVKEDGIYKFKNLIESYALFNNLRLKELARPEDVELYDETAYRH